MTGLYGINSDIYCNRVIKNGVKEKKPCEIAIHYNKDNDKILRDVHSLTRKKYNVGERI